MFNYLGKIERFFEGLFGNISGGIFKKGEISFMGWFFVIFLGSIAVLAALGLLPSELKEESTGSGFVESGERALNSIFGGEKENSQQNSGTEASQVNVSGPSSIVKDTAPKTMPSTGPAVGSDKATSSQVLAIQNQMQLLPSRLIIPSIKVDTVIINSVSTSTQKLDYDLTRGPVRYPGSGTIGFGNMFIFGHSTGWSVVQNRAYKVFNQIKTLKPGDVIYVESRSGSNLGGASAPVKTFEYRVRLVTEVNKNETLITFDTSVNMLTLSTCDSFGAKTDRFVVTADFVGERVI